MRYVSVLASFAAILIAGASRRQVGKDASPLQRKPNRMNRNLLFCDGKYTLRIH
jgi:hypothetical protein